MELDGRVAVISGGTRGIGRAIAEAFLRDGAKVVVSGRDQAKGDQAIAEMNDELGATGNVAFVQSDATKRADCERLIDTAIEQFGRVDILVNNAGGSKNNAPVAQLTDEAMDYALTVNLWSTLWCTRKALEHMIPQQWGRIINISSVEGKMGKPGLSTYVAAKHAVNGLTKSCAQEVGTLGITVNALCAGAIETDMMKTEGPPAAESMGMTYQGLLDLFAQESAIKRLNEVEDVAAVASLLVSEAGAGITGSLISIDGGTSPY
ncbi:MAG TPA: SDR family NAD(P)-dependent oxidoreductase [Ilumatobacteraceae bacterium]|nr:SDR family NAD(P)-dependent oxidoreductase [Ilumatobacteraceae bacterium]